MDDGYPLSITDQWRGFAAAGFADGIDAAWLNPLGVSGGGAVSAREFYDRYHDFAEQSEAATGVPKLVTLGQAALESAWGSSAPGNNFFGIKAKASDPEETHQLLKTTEVFDRDNMTGFPEIISVTPRSDGRFTYMVRDWFRTYPSPAEAFIGHGNFLRNTSRYAAAFQHTDDPYAFAQEVARAGYATAPNYFSVLAGRMRQIEAVSQ
jgi:flagellum-specific peptidoglycan hydrolase FlgJ